VRIQLATYSECGGNFLIKFLPFRVTAAIDNSEIRGYHGFVPDEQMAVFIVKDIRAFAEVQELCLY
jgi:hypothetical protein